MVTFSAPGSLMLFGEHAVLRGHPALVCAIDRRIKVSLEATTTGEVVVESGLGRYRSRGSVLQDHPSFRFVLACLRRYVGVVEGGLDVRIDSEIDPTIGFGSSAAVTVALLAGLKALGCEVPDGMAVARVAQGVIREVQGRGSGADAAASGLGGVVWMRPDPLEAVCVACPEWGLTTVYCGYKMPTAEVVGRVDAAAGRDPEVFKGLFEVSERLVGEAVAALRVGDVRRLGALMNAANGLHEAYGVNTRELSELVFELREDEGITGAKISGSGLGDCVVGLGRSSRFLGGAAARVVGVDKEGVKREA
ncbi:MAG TPA: hypothetical protein PKE55_13635 [Kiritimatiellia bacterium]|nr:hypothetical protein [Kiritimatiellia bacterium]